MIQYRKAKCGQWVGFGPESEVKTALKESSFITITKKDGTTKKEYVRKLGKPFNINNVPHVYAYLGDVETGEEKIDKKKYPRTGCSCGSRDGIIQDSDCWHCKHDAE